MRLKSGLSFNPTICKASSAESGEEGYILLAVLFLVVMVLITLSIAAPKVAEDIQRDREIELMHRGMQYRRAIQLYYKKFNAYPPNMDALVKTNEIRFLRKRYVDPATGKDEWHLIHFGENKTPTAMGFFGQAIVGSTLGGIGPGGVGQNMGTPIGGSAFGNNSAGGGAFGGSSSGFGGSSIGGSSIGGSSPLGASTDPNSGNAAGAATNVPGASGTAGATGTDSSATGSSTFGSSGSTSFGSNSSSQQTFGGGGIIGVESTSPKATILEYKKKKHFNEWEFVYDPLSERQQAPGGAGIGQPIGGPGNGTGTSPFGNTPSLSDQPPGVSGSPPNGGTQGNPTNPTQPQQ